MVCVAPSTVLATVYGWKFWMTPCEQKTRAATKASGSSTYSVARVRSTQKFPIRSASCRANPRISAMATAMPAAADAKFCTASAAIWTR